MRVLAVVPYQYDTVPGQRFRIEQWEPWLRDLGVDITYDSFESEALRRVLYRPGTTGPKVLGVLEGFRSRIGTLRRLREFDLVYLFREAALVGPAILERWIRRSGVPLVFDFDDAIFVPNTSEANATLGVLKCPGKTRTICRLASHVMAGNRYLADYASQVNARVSVIPTTIDTRKYTVSAPRHEDGPPVIGWSGSRTTVQYLNTVVPALKELRRRHPFRLRVIGTSEYRVEGVDVDAREWRSATEIDDLRPLDIGLMPLPDDQWAKGKCGLKALQYMALGVPAVCSPVGVNSEIIRHGQNGLLASSQAEWVDALAALIQSPELRMRLGQAGRATVEAGYSAEMLAPRVKEIFQSVGTGARRPAVEGVR